MTMFLKFARYLIPFGVGAFAWFPPQLVQADGMVPDTSVVIVNEVDGEASVSVTNTDDSLVLLHVTIENIPEDTEPLVFVTPPLARVEPSRTQLIRFILQSEKPLLTQRLKRVIFEGIPQTQARCRGRACPGGCNGAPESAGHPSPGRPGAQPHTLDRPAMVAAGRPTDREQPDTLRRTPGSGTAIAAFRGPCNFAANLPLTR